MALSFRNSVQGVLKFMPSTSVVLYLYKQKRHSTLFFCHALNWENFWHWKNLITRKPLNSLVAKPSVHHIFNISPFSFCLGDCPFEHDSAQTLRNAAIPPFLSLCLLVFPTVVTQRNGCQIQLVWFQLCHVFVKSHWLGFLSFSPFMLGQVACFCLIAVLALDPLLNFSKHLPSS